MFNRYKQTIKVRHGHLRGYIFTFHSADDDSRRRRHDGGVNETYWCDLEREGEVREEGCDEVRGEEAISD